MAISKIRVIEASSGILTGLLGFINFLISLNKPGIKRPWFVLTWLFASILVAAGSYFHAIQGKRWGRIPLFAGGIILTLIFLLLLAFLGEVLYVAEWSGLWFIALGAMAVVALIASGMNKHQIIV